MSTWKNKPVDQQLVGNLQRQFEIPEIMARVLANRGIRSISDSQPFFSPDIDQLHDPFLMLNMEKAAGKVAEEIREGGHILVFGDYDVDGTTGSSMLFLFLRSVGARPSVYIPDREKEGYGLSSRGVDLAVEKGARLLITCDCGISAVEAVEYANSRGIEVIITDHHTPGTALPEAFAILNPKQTGCSYPFKELCGGGVAFKLVCAVAQLIGCGFHYASEHLDLITLGTAADIVPLIDENRIIVSNGIHQLEETARPGLRALLDVCSLSGKELTVGRLIFWVAPRINAAGRLGDANRAVKLLTTEDFGEAVNLARELNNENRSRQTIQQVTVDEAHRKINAEVDLEHQRAIVLWKEGWHPGVIGIVSSKIKEEFHRPVVTIAMNGERGKGSARSISKFDVYEILAKCAPYLDDYGGHPMAAGLNISARNLESFRKAFVDLANESLGPEDMVPELHIDGEMELSVIDKQFMDFMKKLAPYGPGNSRPQFVSRNVQVAGSPRIVGSGDHLKFTARQGSTRYDVIGFNLAKHYEQLITGDPVDLAFRVEENEWKGKKSIQLNLQDIKKSGEKTS
ncbi:MAG: single-stranded-DNA-specific exonuclease RecJ [Candidatus Neomarinimicrobiota bacterium]